MKLMPHQQEAVDSLSNGRILYGGVGSGKSATALAYYMRYEQPRDLYVITTAKKRDSLEWESEAARFGIGNQRNGTVAGLLTVDSWNRIGNYIDRKGAFFIFDEQRLVGSGAWVRHFLTIAASNNWILLSGTPGDTWLDYAPVFIANKWFRNITDFKRQHVIYEPFVKFPRVKGYIGQARLERLRNEVLVEMPYAKHTNRIINHIPVGFDKAMVKKLKEERWNYIEDRPIVDSAELWRYMRMVVNTDPSRIDAVRTVLKAHPRLIIYYSFNYELEILRTLSDQVPVAEWNGHKHEPLPDGPEWVYLVHYLSGAEGWNCTSTNAMLFWSLTSSYKHFTQAQGRIDRLDTEYRDLYYYILESDAYIDTAIKKRFAGKKDFNERRGIEEWLDRTNI